MSSEQSIYLIPLTPVTFEQTIKGSRFICVLGHGTSQEQIFRELELIRLGHPKATHVCWAYIAGPPGSPARGMSDAGEPKGTAGRPMLNVLDHSGFGEIWAAVIRYFGGIKLGKGGLIRAYTSSVQQALSLVETEERQPMLPYLLDFDYNLQPVFEKLLEESGVQIIERTYALQVSLSLLVPETKIPEIGRKIAELSGGMAKFKEHPQTLEHQSETPT